MPAFASAARVVASWTLALARSAAGTIRRRLAQSVALIPRDEAVDDRIEVAGFHELRELVVLEVDPVVRDPRFGIVIGADLLASVAGADRRAACLGQGGLLLGQLPIQDAGQQDLHRLGPVLELRALVLRGRDDRLATILR